VDQQLWTYLFVGLTFGLYIAIALWARAGSTEDFYVAGPFLGYGGSVYLMGWTGGYVLLALLLAPFLREFGKFTVPDFVGDRYYSKIARIIAVICALMVSFTYIAGYRLHLCGARRDEGDYLYAGCAICRADFRLYCACDFYLTYRHE